MKAADEPARVLHQLTGIAPLLDRQQARGLVALLPPVPGLYAWYFCNLPDCVPVAACQQRGAFRLAYAGIAPQRPRAKDGLPSKATLRSRILGSHFDCGSTASTLRLTLGTLLARRLGIALRVTGKGGKVTFGRSGERQRSDWMAEHGRVVVVPHDAAWTVERSLITELHAPLNLRDNAAHPFHSRLTALREGGRSAARSAAKRDAG